ncbi:MAG TPA: HEAT repeat domain-containing protein [Planctomycetota bacterium]|nr:HEAT repeat domain-containing protein [Planctomycetota bacterium]
MIAVLLCVVLAADDKEADAALVRFRQAYRSLQPAARAAAVSELSRVPHERTLKAIVPLLTTDAPEVRAAAAKGLGAFTEHKKFAVPMLLSALGPNQKEPMVRCAIYTGLGQLNDDLGYAEVVKAFRTDRADVAKAAIAAAGKMRRKEAVDALIELSKDIQDWIKKKQSGGYRDDKNQLGDEGQQKGRLEDIQKQVLASLQEITGEKWVSAQEWEIWWSRRKATFEVPPAK